MILTSLFFRAISTKASQVFMIVSEKSNNLLGLILFGSWIKPFSETGISIGGEISDNFVVSISYDFCIFL